MMKWVQFNKAFDLQSKQCSHKGSLEEVLELSALYIKHTCCESVGYSVKHLKNH